MAINHLAEEIERTERRYRERAEARERTRSTLNEKGVLAADSAERVDRRLARLNADRATAEAVGEGKLAAASSRPAPGEADLVGLERLLGANNLIGVSFLEAGHSAARSVGRIVLYTAAGGVAGYGTGFMVSPRLLVTNNHVLARPEEASLGRVEFNYQVGPEGATEPATSFSLEPERFFVSDPGLDYTLVAVAASSPDGTELRAFGYNRLIEAEGKVILGEYLNVIQHPGGEPKQLALRENQLIDVLEDFLHYETDTAPGSSGSPVLNDQWQVVALHHSGVPARDADGNILALDGRPWEEAMGEHRIRWLANEGARISRVVAHLKEQRLQCDEQRALREGLLAYPARRPPSSGPSPAPVPAGPRPRVPEDGPEHTTVFTVPLRVSVSLGSATPPAAPAATAAPAPEAELEQALSELAAASTRPYYEETADCEAAERYYQAVGSHLEPGPLYEALSRLVTTTHHNTPAYKPAQHVYPWVDLHPDRKLRSVYSGQVFEPESLIREDFAVERWRAERLREVVVSEAAGAARLAEEIDALEAALPFNCEHVVPQSWFSKREPMRGDLHHLFACESRCNSFRGNTPYFDFADFEEVVRDACGKREADGFEPSAGKGAVARAVLYFLLRYPNAIGDPEELEAGRLATLLEWHTANPVGEYERHRNMAIFAVQGNRNPLIDHPEWAARVGFDRGLG